ncbi:ATP-binding protein [Parabacteroides chinchillae]|uniref:Sigma-B regulation protein RsbU (Phosphoserine phosphatase) n=1 Tax=Parabacteroides chinchillae TaxID=871327 RepID=A0A8G2BV33_9BACT|nr:ATP-binding protein [Parabacteroides chinchillae]SEF66705.1 sigma-B regulation protein RsbU (phosphoserine phosphatase) [Parabacteroides chinchillae]
MQKTLCIENDIKELDRINDFLEVVDEEFHLPSAFRMKLNLVLEEAVSNIIFYAYKPGEKGCSINIVVSYDKGWLTLMLTDSGIAFDPTKRENPDITLSAEERPIGGLGIFLIKQIMDEVSYRREKKQNVLIMKKKIKA